MTADSPSSPSTPEQTMNSTTRDEPRRVNDENHRRTSTPNTGVASMGTRADFYIGRGESAEWLGSVAFDGYPDGITPFVLESTSAEDFRRHLSDWFSERDDVTLPAMGWPWPWEDSRTTDYAYAFDGGKVWASCFGHSWFDPTIERTEDDYAEVESEQKEVFPQMDKSKSAQAGSKRSGIMVFTAPGSCP